jgi:hypothetical protein
MASSTTFSSSNQTKEEGEGEPPHLVMEVILDRPLCHQGDTSPMKVVELWPLSDKWLGHDVVVTGSMEGTADGFGLHVNTIREADAP